MRLPRASSSATAPRRLSRVPFSRRRGRCAWERGVRGAYRGGALRQPRLYLAPWAEASSCARLKHVAGQPQGAEEPDPSTAVHATDRYAGHLMPGNEDEAPGLLDAYLERAETATRVAPLG
jgi:hypothetical protein